MFREGEYVVYGHHGVCRVDGTTTLDMKDIPKNKQYICLRPIDDGGTVYIPADKCEEMMRRILTNQEANQLILEIKDIPPIDIDDEKYVEQAYKASIRGRDYTELIRMIKYIYQRAEKRSARGKKMSGTDEKYMNLAESALYTELGIALDIPTSEVLDYIMNVLKE